MEQLPPELRQFYYGSNALRRTLAATSGTTPRPEPPAKDERAANRFNDIEIDALPKQERERFPVENLPPTIRDFCVESAETLQAEPDMLALFALGHLSGAIGFTRRLRLKGGWLPPANLWIAVVADPGMLKTPSLSKTAGPLNAYQEVLNDQYDEEEGQYLTNLALWEHASTDSRGNRPKAPVPKQLVARDVTVEAVTRLLAQNPRGVMMSLDELSGWLASFGEYKGGAGHDRATWLTGWSVDQPLTTNRQRDVGRALYVAHPWIAVCGGLQPSKLPSIRQSQAEDDGMLDRFLFGFPESVQRRWNDKEVNPLTASAYDRTFRHLLELQMDGYTEDGKAAPRIISMSPDARLAFITAYDEHHEASQAADFDSRLSGAWSKLDEQAARIALVLFCTKVAEGTFDYGDGIDAQSIMEGWAIARYFASGAALARNMLVADHFGPMIDRTLRYMEKRGVRSVTATDVFKSHFVKDADEAKQLFRAMVNRQLVTLDISAKQGGDRWTITLKDPSDPMGLHDAD